MTETQNRHDGGKKPVVTAQPDGLEPEMVSMHSFDCSNSLLNFLSSFFPVHINKFSPVHFALTVFD